MEEDRFINRKIVSHIVGPFLPDYVSDIKDGLAELLVVLTF